jgi:hypothetical protein
MDIRIEKVIEDQDWDKLVSETYVRPAVHTAAAERVPRQRAHSATRPRGAP